MKNGDPSGTVSTTDSDNVSESPIQDQLQAAVCEDLQAVPRG